MYKKSTIEFCKKHGETPHDWVGRNRRHKQCTKCQTERVAGWRRRAKRKLVEYKGGKCELCGYNKSVAALDFHHTDPETKRFSLSGKGLTRKYETMVEEVDKCMLLCANCHREIHSSGVADG